jgi:hypothetical protein
VFKNVKWLRLTPDRPGRGGWKTGVHTFQQEPINDVRILSGAHVYHGAWTKEQQAVAYPALPQNTDPAGVMPLAVHGYVYPSLTDPSAQPGLSILTQHTSAGGAKVWDQVTGLRQQRPPTIQRGVFQDIHGRCFFGEGAAEGLVMDDRTPAIHAQKNQNLGIGTPQQPMGPTTIPGGFIPNFAASTIPNVVPYGTAYMFGGSIGSYYLNHPNPNNQLGTILATDTVTVGFLDPNMAGAAIGAVNGIYALGSHFGAGTSPAIDAVTSNITPFAATGTISITTGTSLVTLTGAVWPGVARYAGLSINFNGYSFVILDHGTDGTGLNVNGTPQVLSNVQLLILGVYDGPTVTNLPYTITGCQVTFTAPWAGFNGLGTQNTTSVTPPGFAFGYSQSTASNLTQVAVQAVMVNGLFRNLGTISLGPVGTGPGNIIHNGQMSAPVTATNLRSPGSFQWTANDVGKSIYVDKAGDFGGLGQRILATTIQAFIASSSITLAAPNASGGAVNNATVVWGWNFTGTLDASMLGGTVDLLSASNLWFASDVGKQVIVADAGNAGNTVALVTRIASFVNAGHVKLVLPNAGGNVTAKQAYWGGEIPNLTPGPTYAYAWYDPETGHCSNISPMYQVPIPTLIGIAGSTYSDMANLTPVFPIDPGSISYPAGIDALRFSHILFFRTLSTPGASTLYPIGSLQPFVGKVHPGQVSTRGSWSPSTFHGWMGVPNNYLAEPLLAPNTAPNYWYDFSSDEDLLVAGGFRAPQETNEKPMVLLRGGAKQAGRPYAMAYWDGRTWLVNTQDPGVIQFSCDYAQCPLGLPEESFPPTNILTLPSVDGRVIGMRTVGDMLLVTTEKWAYIIVGNNESNYRLMKASSSMPGVGLYQMDEFPTYTGAEGEPTTLFYLGRDRIVYQWTMGGPTTPISGPIQDQLDTFLLNLPTLFMYQNSLVHCVSAWGRRLVVVAPYSLNVTAAGLPAFLYDIDNQVWSFIVRNDYSGSNFAGNSPMCTVYGLEPPVNEVFALYASAYGVILTGSWLRDDTPCHDTMKLVTFPMNFDGKKTRKQLVAVNIHATAGVTWDGAVSVDEGPLSYIFTFGPYPDPLESIYAPPPAGSPVDGNLVDNVVMAAQFSATPGPQMPLVGYRFYIQIQSIGATVPVKLYAIDISYVDYEEPGEGEV